jgi:hypothetical protein
VFEADKPIDEETKGKILADVAKFNKDYIETLKFKWLKFPKKIRKKAMGSISDYEGTDFIGEVIVEGNMLKLLVSGQYMSSTGFIMPDFLVRSVLKRAVKDFIKITKDYSVKA